MAVSIINGNCTAVLAAMPDQSVHCCVTSPPYFGLRDYGHPDQIGLEPTPELYVEKLAAVFSEVRRVLRDDGTLWLNLGDSYAGSRRGMGDVCSTNKGNGASREVGSLLSAGLHDRARQADQIGRAWPSPPAGLKNKDLIGIPWRVAFALQSAGWYLRQDIIWHKPAPMPESVTDRCTKAHEYIFLLSKSADYYFDQGAIAEVAAYGSRGSHFDKGKTADHQLGRASKKPRRSGARGGFAGKTNELEGREAFRAIVETRNKRSVWTVATTPYRGAHFATFPPSLIRPCILAGCPQGGIVLDPFGGSGTTGQVAEEEGRNSILIELNPDYIELARTRTAQSGLFAAA